MSVITSSDYKSIMGDKQTVTIDVRTPREVAAESIPCELFINAPDCTPAAVKSALENQGVEEGERVYVLCQSGARADQVKSRLGSDFPWELIKIDGGLNALKQSGVNVKVDKKMPMPLERQVRIAAGLLVVLGVVLSELVNYQFIYLSGFVGAGLMFAGITNTCGMALMLAKMPWNK